MRVLVLGLLLLSACPSAPEARPDSVAGPRDVVASEVEAPLTPPAGTIRPTLRHEQLDNGLDVYLVPDHTSPLVVVQVWVKTGSRNEHEATGGADHGTTGLSHFFEHLMFQGTQRFPSYDDALTPLGAQNNAFTYQDATVFWAYTPKQHLRLVLDIEADRFEHMNVDFLHVEPERAVVENERREHTDASPTSLAEELATKNAFDHSAYRWGPIGWMRDLDAITLDEVQAYHALHYHPAGAFLVIAGDLDADQTMAWVHELWGPIAGAAHAAAPPRPPVAPETWQGPRSDHVIEDSPTTSVVWEYRAPPPGGTTTRAYAALEIIDYVLTAGKSGRLQKRLVYSDTPEVSELGASLGTLADPYLYEWNADLLPDATVAGVEAALDEELSAVAAHGVSPDELVRAVAGLRTTAVQAILSNSERAEGIGFALVSAGDPFAQFARLEAYPSITQAELQAVASTYLVPATRSRVAVVAPKRLQTLSHLWTDRRPPAPLGPLMNRASDWFVSQQVHQRSLAEADREERAIALLAQRADVAKAADPSAKAAIDKYLSDSEAGVTKRRARLATTRKALALKTRELEAQRVAFVAQLAAVAQTSAARVGGPMRQAIELLLAAPSEGLGVPMPPRELTGISDDELALHVVSAWVCEARGLFATAQRARAFVLRAAAQLGDKASPLARGAYALAFDTSVEGLALVDTPSFVVRPTRSGR